MNLFVLKAKEILSLVETKDYIQWAESLLIRYPDSNNLAQLAGFSLDQNPNIFEVKKYFKLCLEELNLQLPQPEEAFLGYARGLAQDIIYDKMDVYQAIKRLAQIWHDQDNPNPVYKVWFELDEDIDSLKARGDTIFDYRLTQKNHVEIIKQTAIQFLNSVNSAQPDYEH